MPTADSKLSLLNRHLVCCVLQKAENKSLVFFMKYWDYDIIVGQGGEDVLWKYRSKCWQHWNVNRGLSTGRPPHGGRFVWQYTTSTLPPELKLMWGKRRDLCRTQAQLTFPRSKWLLKYKELKMPTCWTESCSRETKDNAAEWRALWEIFRDHLNGRFCRKS